MVCPMSNIKKHTLKNDNNRLKKDLTGVYLFFAFYIFYVLWKKN